MRILLLDGALLTLAFAINVKCAAKMQVLLSSSSLWGRIFVWL